MQLSSAGRSYGAAVHERMNLKQRRLHYCEILAFPGKILSTFVVQARPGCDFVIIYIMLCFFMVYVF